MLDPLDVWSTNLIETISRNLNGTDCVTICWGGKRRERKDEYSCFVEVFPFSVQPTDNVSSMKCMIWCP